MSQKHIARNWLADVKSMLEDDDTGVFVDGGSYRGDLAHEMAKSFPRGQVHAFEPNSAMFEKIQTRFEENQQVTCHHAAISSRTDHAVFRVTNRPDCASLLEPGDSAKRWHGEIMEIEREERVKTVRLDEAFAGQKISLLKLDLQGHELDALHGADGILEATKIILVEVSFIPFYAGQPLYHEIASLLCERNFRLHYLCDVWLRPNGQITQADAMFVNESYFQLADVN